MSAPLFQETSAGTERRKAFAEEGKEEECRELVAGFRYSSHTALVEHTQSIATKGEFNFVFEMLLLHSGNLQRHLDRK